MECSGKLFDFFVTKRVGTVVHGNCEVICVTDLPSTGKTAVAAGGTKQPAAAAAVASGGMSDADADLEARLDNLRRQ